MNINEKIRSLVYIIVRVENKDGSYKIVRVFSESHYFEATKFFYRLDTNFEGFTSPYRFLTYELC